MPRDLLESPNQKPQGSKPQGLRPPGPGRLVVTGVVGACALGVALGIWARPTPLGEAAAAKAMPPRLGLQVVVDDTPAPLGAPLEVLSADFAGDAPVRIAAPPAPVEPLAVPQRPVSGLMKVDAVVATTPIAAPAVHANLVSEKPRAAPPKPAKAQTAESPKSERKVEKAKLAAAKLAETRAAEAKTRKSAELAEARAAKLEKAKATKLAEARKAEKIQKAAKLAKAEATGAKAMKTAKAERAAKAAAAKAAALARAEKADAEKAARILKAKAETRQKRLEKLLKTVKAEVRQAVHPKATKVAALKPVAKPAPMPKKAAAKRPVVRGEGPMRVARSNACASSDPGEAIVCADRRLGARDRQLQDAYRSAEAAGVPATALRNQQSRWLAARAAAAREAPWAVEDVYVARISELRDQTRDAGDE